MGTYSVLPAVDNIKACLEPKVVSSYLERQVVKKDRALLFNRLGADPSYHRSLLRVVPRDNLNTWLRLSPVVGLVSLRLYDLCISF